MRRNHRDLYNLPDEKVCQRCCRHRKLEGEFVFQQTKTLGQSFGQTSQLQDILLTDLH